VKFSKDKKPTEAGWYWYRIGLSKPIPKKVMRSQFTGFLHCGGYQMRCIERTPGEWGDKIEIPTVEDSERAGVQP